MTMQTDALNPVELFKAKVRDNGKFILPYRLYVPERADKRKLPFLLLMHGMGSVGNDNISHISSGAGTSCNAGNILAYMKMRGEQFIILAPQSPYAWVDTDWTKIEHKTKESPTPALESVLELTNELVESLNVDKDRIYVTGASMGGFASWELMARAPELFAASIVVCGGGDPALADRIKHIPVWFTHGDADEAVPCENSRLLYDAMRRNNADTIRSIYPGFGHNVWESTYTNAAYLDWLFSKSLQQKNKYH